MRNYLMYLLEDIERRKNTNCYYVSESTLNTLNNDLGYIRDYLSSSSLESYIDRAFEHLASSWPAHNGRRVVDIAQSTYNHYVDEAEKRIKEIRDQADKIDSLKDEFDDFLESTKNEIVETKEVVEKRTDEIEEAINARRKEMGEQYEDFLVSAKENAEKSIEQITESYIETPKTKSGTRQVPLSKETIQAFQRVIKKRPKAEPFVIDGRGNFLFVNQKGKPKVAIDYNALFVRMVKRYNKQHKDNPLPHITPHTLRHTFCTRLASKNMNPKDLQYIMGHSNISITMNWYAHASIDTAKSEVQRLIA